MASQGFPTFPAASQTDIIRAAQKDELYQRSLANAIRDCVRQLLGPLKALQYTREIDLLGDVLYNSITTGSGEQTLGEEYCDLLQINGSSVEPTPVQRGLLVLYKSVLPFMSDKLLMHSVGNDYDELDGTEGSDEEPSQRPSSRSSQLRDYWVFIRSFVQDHTDVIRVCAGYALRLQLALFYLYGVYYHISHRAARVQHAYISGDVQRRPRYFVLGVLLMMQMGTQCMSRLVKLAARSRQNTSETSLADVRSSGRLAILDENGTQISSRCTPEVSTTGEKCSLCLSSRTDPTSTPCGHVFCWNCVAEWCTQREECPLCRSNVRPQELVRVFGGGF
ncbi:hypothetical protein BSKO_00900 [Bryopsis sp. KO-2023]|nr:hypothetical protein BSKO_00900 [Bryopsis sp. KO-2023]